MRGGAASKQKSHNEAHGPKLVEAAGLADLAESIRHSIACRAYELYEARGREDGHDLEDWFRAGGRGAPASPGRDYRGRGPTNRARAQVPDFSAEEVTVGIEPRRVIIWGKKKTSARMEPQQTHQDQFLRVLDPTRRS